MIHNNHKVNNHNNNNFYWITWWCQICLQKVKSFLATFINYKLVENIGIYVAIRKDYTQYRQWLTPTLRDFTWYILEYFRNISKQNNQNSPQNCSRDQSTISIHQEVRSCQSALVSAPASRRLHTTLVFSARCQHFLNSVIVIFLKCSTGRPQLSRVIWAGVLAGSSQGLWIL